MSAVLGLALIAGMVAALNPCAFSLLPAYIGFFVNVDNDRTHGLDRRLLRALGSALAVTTGFVVFFVVAGSTVGLATTGVRRNLPWVTMAVGAGVVAGGLAVVAGWRPPTPKPTIAVGLGRGAPAMVFYGVVYALASLSCTLAPFVAVTTAALSRSAGSALLAFLAYALGMGLVISGVAFAAAVARSGPVGGLRRLSRHATRCGGLLMVASGGYAIWYGRWELSVYAGDLSSDPLVDRGERLRLALANGLERVGPVRIALVLLATFALGVLAARRGGGADHRSGASTQSRPSCSVGALPDRDCPHSEAVPRAPRRSN